MSYGSRDSTVSRSHEPEDAVLPASRDAENAKRDYRDWLLSDSNNTAQGRDSAVSRSDESKDSADTDSRDSENSETAFDHRFQPDDNDAADYDGPTQPDKTPPYVPDPTLWGCLQPLGHDQETIWFRRSEQVYHFGREVDTEDRSNYVRLRGSNISRKAHCEIQWDVMLSGAHSVVLKDGGSENGRTWVNQSMVAQNSSQAVDHGDEVAFGTREQPKPGEELISDHRYVFRFVIPRKEDNGELYKKYNLFEELGKGSFGNVIRVRLKEGPKDGEKEKNYAAKVVRKENVRMISWDATLGEDSGEPETQIEREAASMKKLGKHAHICQLEEFFSEEHWLALVMEFIDGGDLRQYMQKHHKANSIGEHKAAFFTYQICDGLAFMHRQRIAHRDLKPENILLTTEDPPRVKIADFGLSTAVGEAALLKTYCGTPAYIAPEVKIRGSEGYDMLVDSWSVGVMASEMVTSPRRIPFNIGHGTPQILWGIFGGLSGNARRFVEELLQIDSQQRMNMARACDHPWLALPRRLMARRLELVSDAGGRTTSEQNRDSGKDADEEMDATEAALYQFFHLGIHSELLGSASGEAIADTIDDACPFASDRSRTASQYVVAGSEMTSADVSTADTSQARRRTRSSAESSPGSYSTHVSKRARFSRGTSASEILEGGDMLSPGEGNDLDAHQDFVSEDIWRLYPPRRRLAQDLNEGYRTAED